MDRSAATAEALARLKGMFRESPGTRVSVDEACRLAGLERQTCEAVLEDLQRDRFLRCSEDGRFSERSD